MAKLRGMGPGCCCTRECCVFLPLSFPELDPGWDVISGELHTDGTLDGGSVLGSVESLPTGDGGFSIEIDFGGNDCVIRFCYKDASNHWRLDVVHGNDPITGLPAMRLELFEVFGGVTTPQFDRYVDVEPTIFRTCWKDNGNILLDVRPFDEPDFEFPNHVIGGNNFRIEPAGDITIITGAGDDFCVLFNHDDTAGVPPNPNDCCSFHTCDTCRDQWGDTMQVEIMDGPDAGDIYTIDRYRADALVAPEHITSVAYWFFYNLSTNPYVFVLRGCLSTNSLELNELQLTVTAPFVSAATSPTVTITDCEGPYTFVVPNVFGPGGFITYEVTPSPP